MLYSCSRQSPELVRFTNSGSEAAVLAARLARHVTGRRRIVIFEGGYHGTGERFADPSDEVTRLPYNDAAALRRAIDDSVGAIFVEPFLGSGGVVVAQDEFLRAIQESARAVGAVGGRRDLLDLLSSSSARQLAHSGTFNGYVLSMVAGAVSMDLLTAGAIARMDRMAAVLAADITRAGKLAGLDVTVTRAGSILHVHFLSAAPVDYREAERADRSASALLHLALLNNGVYTAPGGMLNLSTVLSDDAVGIAAEAYARSFAAVAREGGTSR